MKDVNWLLIYLLEREGWLVAVPQKVRSNWVRGKFPSQIVEHNIWLKKKPGQTTVVIQCYSLSRLFLNQTLLFEFNSRKVFIPLFGARSLAFFSNSNNEGGIRYAYTLIVAGASQLMLKIRKLLQRIYHWHLANIFKRYVMEFKLHKLTNSKWQMLT